MDRDEPFQSFSHDHHDLVQAVHFNFYGNRMVTAGSDQKLKVWDRKADEWRMVDSWKAHNAEITDVKWNGPFVGQILGSVAEDGFFKLWEEDISQPPGSGRRFRSIMTPLASKTQSPWCSIDFKNINTETYLALITRDGELSIMEPKDHDMLSTDWTDWMQGTRFRVCPEPGRAEETSFRVAFHHEKMPCWQAVAAGLDPKALSLAVVSMETVRIYRTDRERKVYLAAEISGGQSLIRDVSWAGGSMRGFDLLATGSADGRVRVYELRTPGVPALDFASQRLKVSKPLPPASNGNGTTRIGKSTSSGIGAGIASANRMQMAQEEDDNAPGRLKQEVTCVADLKAHSSSGSKDQNVQLWRVAFSSRGDVLLSTGDDGTIRTWKIAANGRWTEYAQMDVEGYR